MTVGLTINRREMTERITFRKVTRSADGAGGFTETWSDYATVWAKVRPLRGSDRVQAAQIEDRRDYEVTIHYRSDITDDMAILWNGLVLGIRFRADFGPRSRFLRIEAESGVQAEANASG